MVSRGGGLADLRQAAGMTQEELAERCGLSARAISSIESGRVGRPHRRSLLAIADALGLDAARRDALIRNYRRPAAVDAHIAPADMQHRTVGIVPRQLPSLPSVLLGRADELRILHELGAGDATMLAVLSGPAGVGKTALAVHWAHAVRDRYTDGQLYVNLEGYGPGLPREPASILVEFLRDLGVPPEQVPAGLAERTALFRSVLADRRALVLLDNARDAEQVRPLLPGGVECAVVVTSRSQLRGLAVCDGATAIPVGRLGQEEAGQLLAGMLGNGAPLAEPEAVTQIVTCCDGLPLALRVVGERAARRPGQPLAALADELADARMRLDAMDAGEGDRHSDLRAVLSWSYRALTEPAARLFRLLSLHPGTDFDQPAAAHLADLPGLAAGRLLDTLVGVHLVEDRGDGRYGLHDLLRLYAVERAAVEDTETDLAAATARLFGWYLRTADHAIRLLRPERTGMLLPADQLTGDSTAVPFADPASALAWLDSERVNLTAVARRAGEIGPRPVAWLLVTRLRPYFAQRQHVGELLSMAGIALEAALADSDPHAEAECHIELGTLLGALGRADGAAEHFSAAQALGREHGWPQLEYRASSNLGILYIDIGRLADAAEQLDKALTGLRELRQDAPNVALQGKVARILGVLYRITGGLDDAKRCFTQSLLLAHKSGDRFSEARALTNLGEVAGLQGRMRDAVNHLAAAAETCRSTGDRFGQSVGRTALADLCAAAGRHGDAVRHATAALELAQETGDSEDEGHALNSLGRALTNLGLPDQAIENHTRALQIGEPYQKCEAHLGLAQAHLEQRELASAGEHAAVALRLAQSTGYRLLEGSALAACAAVHRARGDTERAQALAQQALGVHRATGHRLGEAQTLLLLGQSGPARNILDTLRLPDGLRPTSSWTEPRSAREQVQSSS